jgi:SagB-type dehydrogenase family enzyme
MVCDIDGPDGLPALYYLLRRLRDNALLTWTAHASSGPLVTLFPAAPHFALWDQVRPGHPHVVSRFGYVHRDGTDMVAESPLVAARLLLHDERVTRVLHRFAGPALLDDVTACCSLAPAEAEALLLLLVSAGMLVPTDEDGRPVEDTDPSLRTWEFHDLLFHARSRNGRHDRPVGGTYRFLGAVEPPAAVKPLSEQVTVPLHRPDLDRLFREDPPYAEVQENRRSIRTYGQAPLAVQQLGEFLYRVGRVREELQVTLSAGPQEVALQVAARPYPGGGALHELEIYAAVRKCAGLRPGLYRYDPLDHQLGLRADLTADVDQLLRYAARSIDRPVDELHVLLVLTARVPRMAWKYASVAYSLVLKDVGVLLQTMYLAATAMGLAPCALGGGDADLFARAAGQDYYEECSVGEFLLGTRAD